MKKLQASRRGFLRAMGGAGFAASTARFFVRTAEAAAYPLRFLFVYTNAGRDSDSRCSGTGAELTFGRGLAALEPMKKKVLILDGLKIPDHTGEEHPCGKSALLTTRPAALGTWKATGISFDRYLANKLARGVSFYAGTVRHGGDIDLPISWIGAGTANEAYITGSGPLAQKLFGMPGSSQPSPTPTPSPTPGPSARDLNEVALYDYLMADVKRLQGIAPRTELEKLELHVQALQQIRGGFLTPPASGPGNPTNPPTPGTSPPPPAMLPTCGTAVDLSSAATETDRVSLTIAHAFACGRTQVGVVRIGSEDPYHNYSHWQDGATYRDKMREMDKQWALHFANLLKYLDSFPEGTGTLLDNTIVVWGSDCCGEFGVYPSSGENGLHGTTNMPFVLAGSLGGTIKTGQRILAAGRTNLDLYRTIALQMGVDASDFGDARFTSDLLGGILV